MHVDEKRLLAAYLAANKGIKIDYKEVARMYGHGANYNTMEHKFRVFRKDADRLREEADASGHMAAATDPSDEQKPSSKSPTSRGERAKATRGEEAKKSSKKKRGASPLASDDEPKSKRQKTKTASSSGATELKKDAACEDVADPSPENFFLV